MNIFIDTEFTCLPGDDSLSDIISIGIYCEDGCEYYGCRSDFNQSSLSAFSRESVVPLLPDITERKPTCIIKNEITTFLCDKKISSVWATFPTIEQLKKLFGQDVDVEEIYKKYADWDFQLLLRYMNEVPRCFPSHCENITPLFLALKPEERPANVQAHNALQDAIWNYRVWTIYNEKNI